ncbi:DUF5367 domain-containing protein [Aureispira anguillae]|uniref:DUF5367 domain-containing protein n=1 Tax=Aureispira anguillae TaxID=2864201 RepID=A0A916DP91_9BACT|nr:DUF5367 domain-containing protein [Aureispira anguillae]BDS10389.1 DUF5367 domain-containing protein [Aureispira anguillae]
MNYQNFSVLLGFLVWLLATIVFSVWGHYFFLVENELVILAFYSLVVPLLALLIYGVFTKYQLSKEERRHSAVLMALPGMLLDTFCIRSHYLVFPNFSTEQMLGLSAWLLWVYFVVLLLGVLVGRGAAK